MLNRTFWKGRRVFLTGHTGFKGSWLSLWLKRLGANATGYALDPPTTPSLFVQADVASEIRSICADIRDFSRLRSAIAECQPDIVIHMAAQSVVRRGYEEPIETFSSNVMGTVHVFEALRQLRQPCIVINVTSDKCYENKEWVWAYRENEPLGGHDPYSSSKACAELITSAFRDSYFNTKNVKESRIAVASTRAGNVIGGGDWTCDQLIPDLMRAFVAGRPCLIRNLSAIRPWQFVLEPLHGYLMLAQKLAEDADRFSSSWNFGPAVADAKPVSWIADKLACGWGNGASWVRDTAVHPQEAQYLKLDTAKASESLDWRPLLPLNIAVDWIIEWYRAYSAGDDLRSLTHKQIERYEELSQK